MSRPEQRRKLIGAAIAFSLVNLLWPTVTRAEEQTITIYPNKDAFVDTANSYTNYGTAPDLFTGECEGYLGHNYTATYLCFDLNALPSKISLLDVKLKMFCTWDGNATIPREVAVHWVYYPWWNENTINYDNAPGMYHLSSDELTTFGMGKWYTWDNDVIYYDVYQAYHGGDWGTPAPICWAVRNEPVHDHAFVFNQFNSRECGTPSLRPSLVITYDDNKPPQENDDCDDGGKNPYDIGEGIYPFYTDESTFDGDGTCITSPNIWYRYTPSRSGVACISLCGSGYDTKVAVYDTGLCDECPNNLLICQDNYCGCDEYGQNCEDSQAKLRVVEGVEYLIEVGGSTSQDSGPGIMEVTCCEILCEPGDIDEGEGATPDEYVDDYNGGCDSPSWAVQPIECEQTYCGLTGNYFSAGLPMRDTDWYAIDHHGGDLTWSAAAECPIEVVIYDAIDPYWLCSNPAEVPQRRAVAEPCEVASITWKDAPEGPYWLKIAPWDIWRGEDIAGWPNDCRYRATVHCAFQEDFDSYDAGSQLAGQRGWDSWDGDPNAAEFYVTDVQSQSSPNSLEIDGNDDAVHEHFGYTSGAWEYTTWVYVPQDMDTQQYFVLLNTYPADLDHPEHWSTQVEFDGSTDEVRDYLGDDSVPLVRDQWVEVRVVIDLDDDTQRVYYNDQLVVAEGWTDGVQEGGAVNIGAVDLYGGGAAVPVYYDDMAITRYVPDCPEDVNGDMTVDIDDLFAVLGAWGACDDCPEDIDNSGLVDIDDVFAVLGAWGPCP